MNDLEYQKQAAVTLSKEFHGEKVSIYEVERKLQAAIVAINELDGLKKLLFYGRGAQERQPIAPNMTICRIMQTQVDETILHCLIGIATEAGEGLEQLLQTIQKRVTAFNDDYQGFDAVNIVEESGDGFWYHANLATALGENMTAWKTRNIAKLRKRFKDKFDAFEANNRDLTAEREILESKEPLAPQTDLTRPSWIDPAKRLKDAVGPARVQAQNRGFKYWQACDDQEVTCTVSQAAALLQDLLEFQVVIVEETIGTMETENKKTFDALKAQGMKESDAMQYTQQFGRALRQPAYKPGDVLELDAEQLKQKFVEPIKAESFKVDGVELAKPVDPYAGHKNLADMMHGHISEWRLALELSRDMNLRVGSKEAVDNAAFIEHELNALVAIERAVQFELKKV